MTGFGKATCKLENKNVTLEIKSLNSKQLDIFTRVPAIYREKDLEIRNMISNRLFRGKVEFNLNVEITESKSSADINVPVVKEYYRQLKELGSELNINHEDSIFNVIMRLPDALITSKEELNENEWLNIHNAVDEAISALDEFRLQEGAALKKDLLLRIDSIEQKLIDITPFEEARIKAVREKLDAGLKDISETEKVDTNRFEQELIYYFEKLDITEEKVRLKNHCTYFKEVIEGKGGVGKKLGFIGQEIGREINTIGSKANQHDIQRLVVEMKDELEKIKEQVLNVL